jgi:hypothetical protein
MSCGSPKTKKANTQGNSAREKSRVYPKNIVAAAAPNNNSVYDPILRSKLSGHIIPFSMSNILIKAKRNLKLAFVRYPQPCVD